MFFLSITAPQAPPQQENHAAIDKVFYVHMYKKITVTQLQYWKQHIYTLLRNTRPR